MVRKYQASWTCTVYHKHFFLLFLGGGSMSKYHLEVTYITFSSYKKAVKVAVLTATSNKSRQLGLHQNFKTFVQQRKHQQSDQQPKEWEKIFASHILDKELIYRIYKELLQQNNKFNQITQFKMTKGFKQTFLQKKYTNDQQSI